LQEQFCAEATKQSSLSAGSGEDGLLRFARNDEVELQAQLAKTKTGDIRKHYA
jgi:hypothetical protein